MADMACNTDQQKTKRGRPSGSATSLEASSHALLPGIAAADSAQVPQQPHTLPPQDPSSSPQQTSPTKPTTTKPPVIKALPTVRDHTTDQLTPENDEYIPREFDPEGEKKITPTGHALDGREYKMRTFYVPNRGEKLFMLATECARVLGYRDSYLLFNKNRSLHKIIATQAEKDELIQQDILPYSYRSRQIAIVTAKSMFRQFGARVVVNGRRVRDDYWEGKARKQGFTEEDMAGDKRPGTGKARDVAALEAATNDQSAGMAHQDVTYREAPLPADLGGPLPSLNHNAPIPMIQTDVREYGNIPRQRQDISGVPYQDKTQPSLPNEVMHQASNAAEMSKNITQQRNFRAKSYQESWNKKIEPPPQNSQQKVDQSPVTSQRPGSAATSVINPAHPQPMIQHPGGPQMSPQRFQHQHHPQNPHVQSPVRQAMPPSMRPDLHHPQRSSVYASSQQNPPQPSVYNNYHHPNSHLWSQPPSNPTQHAQPHQSPVSAHHNSIPPQFSPSPHQQQPQHPSQSPHHQAQHLPQMPQGSPQANFYGNMGGMQAGANLYGHMGQQRGIYHQQPNPAHTGSPHPQQQGFMQQSTGVQQAGMQGFAPPPMSGAQGWGNFPASSGF